MGWAYSLLIMKKIIPLSLATFLAAGPASAQMRAHAVPSMPFTPAGASAAAPIPSSFSAPVLSGLTAPMSLLPVLAAPSVNGALPAAIPVKAVAAVPAVVISAVAVKGDAILATGVRAFGGRDGKPAMPADFDRGFDGRSAVSASDSGAAFAGESASAVTPDAVRSLMTLGRAQGAREHTRGRGWERTTFTLTGENGGRLVIQEHVLGEETTSRSLYVSFKDPAGADRTIKVDEDANGRIVLPSGPDSDVFARLVRDWTGRLSPAPAASPDGIRKLMAAVNRAGKSERTSGRNWESTTYTVEAGGGRKIVVRENWLGGRGGVSETSTRVLTMIFTGKDGTSRALSVTEDADGRVVLEHGQNAADFEAEFGYWARALAS